MRRGGGRGQGESNPMKTMQDIENVALNYL